MCILVFPAYPLSTSRRHAPGTSVPQQDLCSLCELIVKNRYKWNWKEYPEALCTGAPAHVRDWCEHFACQLSQCPEFTAGSCAVQNGARGDNTPAPSVVLTPCPSKYVCFTCLQPYFTQQFAGTSTAAAHSLMRALAHSWLSVEHLSRPQRTTFILFYDLALGCLDGIYDNV